MATFPFFLKKKRIRPDLNWHPFPRQGNTLPLRLLTPLCEAGRIFIKTKNHCSIINDLMYYYVRSILKYCYEFNRKVY